MNFVEDYRKLIQETPHRSFKQVRTENCDYTDYLDGGKDCYYVFDGGEVQNVYYSEWIGFSKDCCDSSHVLMSELCYECVDCTECYNSDYLWDCANIADSSYCFSCANCKNCFLCSGLRQKEYYVLNEQFSKEDYKKKVLELRKNDSNELWEKLEEISINTPRQHMHLVQTENSFGDFLTNCSNVYYGFGVVHEQDSSYVFDWGSFENGSDNCDCFLGGDCQLCYECMYVDHCYNCSFVSRSDHCTDCEYCTECYQCKNCFGCGYLHHKQYYFLNQPYSKEEYFKKIEEIKSSFGSIYLE